MNGDVGRAKRLRRNQTDAERVLWFQLRGRRLRGLKFKHQVPIDRYIVDFCCEEARLIIEVDGGQHATRTAEQHQSEPPHPDPLPRGEREKKA
jgi:very-short-patch-repair endonuclease